jgi:thymidylate synthase (FAD)
MSTSQNAKSMKGYPEITLSDAGFPAINAEVYHTTTGTSYLRSPGVVVTARPQTDLSGLKSFLSGFGLGFENYLDDPTELPDATLLTKAAGQACYASFGAKRTMNDNADRYIDNILSSGHGSVLEHANFSLFIYGVSRSLTHELVRHRAGMAYSQLSQRYVSGRVLRFVERPEYAADPQLHTEFEADIDLAAKRYADTAERLLELQSSGTGIMSAEAKTDLRKKVQQAARSVLPNATETFLMVTGNVRAWRHTINMRANAHAETEIRALFVNVYRVLSELDPLLFADMKLRQHTDGTWIVDVKYPKV